MQQQDAFGEAVGNVLSRHIIKSLPEPLRSIIKEHKSRLDKQKRDEVTAVASEKALRSQEATNQLLITLNADIKEMRSDLDSERTKNDALQKKNNVLTWISIGLGILSIVLGIAAFFY
jgi:microcompartment protein CcmL/EutN